MIVFDASTLVGAALKTDSLPERAFLRAEEADVLALSAAVDAEVAEVLSRPKFAPAVSRERRERMLEILCGAAVWFDPAVRVTDYRDAKDNKYLELAPTGQFADPAKQMLASMGATVETTFGKGKTATKKSK